MNDDIAIKALGALAHPYRLTLFKVLMRQGVAGKSAGQLARYLDVPPSSLSFHLAQLEQAGLIRARRHHRQIIYAADTDRVRAFLAFLTGDCFNGHPAVHDEMAKLTDVYGGFTMEDRVYNVLFLCTGNSARSIMAECIMNREGAGKFRGYSAGSMPKGEVLPEIKTFLEHTNYSTEELRSKSWEEFEKEGAPVMDFVFTVCDNAAGEVCPIWPGQPMSAHWGVPDPAGFEGTEAERAAFIAEVYRMLSNRIRIFVNLPIASLDKLTLQKHIERIGRGADRDAESAA